MKKIPDHYQLPSISCYKNVVKKTFLPDFSPPTKQFICAALFFLALLFTYRYEAIFKISSHYLGTATSDAGIYVWLFDTNIKNLTDLPWFNTRGFWPYGNSLAFSDNFILPAIIGWPLLKVLGSKIVAYNIIMLAAGFLNGFLTYLFSYRCSKNPIGSLLAGSIFFTFPFLTLHLGHPQLQFAFFIPLTLLCFFKAINHKSLIFAALTGLSLLGCFLTSVYYAIFIILILLILTVFIVLLQKQSLKNNLLVFVFIALFFTPVIFFVFPYLEVASVFGYRGMIDARGFSANALSYISSPALSLVHNYSSSWSNNESLLFPGSVALVLFTFTFVRLFRYKAIKKSLLLFTALTAFTAISSLNKELFTLTAIGFWLGLTSLSVLFYRVWAQEKKLRQDESISNLHLSLIFIFITYIFTFLSFGPLSNNESSFSLYALLHYYLPGIASIRAVGRFGIVSVFFLSVLVSFAFNYLPKKYITTITVLSFAIILSENYPRFYPLQNSAWQSDVFKTAAQHSQKDDAAIVLPLTTELKENGTIKHWSNFAKLNLNYLNWLSHTDLFLVNGYSGQRTRNMELLPGLLSDFPDQQSLETLAKIANLRLIFFVPEYVKDFNQSEFEDKLNKFSKHITVIDKDPNNNYILKFDPDFIFSNQDYFQAASYLKNSSVTFKIKNNIDKDFDVYLKKYFEQTPYQSYQMLPNSSQVKFKAPKLAQTTAPLQIRVEPESGLFNLDSLKQDPQE